MLKLKQVIQVEKYRVTYKKQEPACSFHQPKLNPEYHQPIYQSKQEKPQEKQKPSELEQKVLKQ